jgi:AcrR family transcriptional regulator
MPLTDDVVVRRKVSVRATATGVRRSEILDAAVEAFTEHGFNATSLRDVAARAGLSHTGLLHHFPDKAGLLEAALDRMFDETRDEFDFRSSDGVTIVQALIGAAERDVRNPENLRFMAALGAESLVPGHPAHGFMRELHRGVRARLTVAMEDLQRRDLYRGAPMSPELAAIQIASLRNGAINEWLRSPDDIDLVEVIKAQLRMLTAVEI